MIERGRGTGGRSTGTAGRPPRRRIASRPPADIARRRRIVALGAAAVIVGLAWFLIALFQPFAGDGEGKVVVEIPRGTSAGEVADILDREGVISSATLFRIRLSLAGKSDEITAGTYSLAGGMSYGDAIDALTGPAAGRTITITVPEGYTIDEVDRLSSEAGLRGDYEKAARRARGFNPARYGAGHPKTLEGLLFPKTYELKPGSTVDRLVEQQLAELEDQIKRVEMGFARSKNLTTYDVLIIASMIEREVQVPEERELVAAVIYNRLSDGEPLAIDATIRYEDRNYDQPLTESRLAMDTPYNTRTRAGLPPTPIGNPGLEAIEAAANPATVDYRYYVIEPGTCGEHVFTSTEQKFLQAQARYQRALEREGGSPTECP